MGVKKFKPVTPGSRFRTGLTFDDIDLDGPERSLTTGRPFKAGRGAGGRISVRRRGGRVKRLYREIDFRRDKDDIEAKVLGIAYDPFRSANVALLQYKDGEKRYILAAKGMGAGDVVQSGDNVPPVRGNALPLESIPLGSSIHNLELKHGRGGQLVRAAGVGATVVAKEKDYVTVRLPSGELRLVFKKCRATMGAVGNEDHMNVSLGKAGRSRWLGRRPKVRGVVMNPVDHPHGGGEGRTSGGRHPVSPWGTPTKGYKTRKKNKPSGKFIVKRRK